MNKTKKGFLKATSILTIIATIFAVIGSIAILFATSIIDEDLIIDLYKSDPTTTVVEEADGGYMIYLEDEDGEIFTIDDETLVVVVKVLKIGCVVMGLVCLSFAIAKMILAIKILQASNKEKYNKGCTIALLVLSILTSAWIETILIIVAMCIKDRGIETNSTTDSQETKAEDIVLKDINE